MKSKVIFIFVIALFGNSSNVNAKAHITEIINNTDKGLFVRNRLGYPDGDPTIIRSWSLKTGKPIQLTWGTGLCVPSRTKSLIKNLIIPNAPIGWTGNNADYYGVGINLLYGVPHFGIQCQPRPFACIYRQGDLLGAWELTQTRGVRKITIENELIFDCSGVLKLISNEKVIDGACYSIEVNQVSKKIEFYQSGRVLHRFKMRPHTLEISIRKTEALKEEPISTDLLPRAYINSFSAKGNKAFASVRFDQFLTKQFFDKFCDFIKNDKFLQRVCMMSEARQDGEIMMTFLFYTDMTRVKFQALLDTFNEAQ